MYLLYKLFNLNLPDGYQDQNTIRRHLDDYSALCAFLYSAPQLILQSAIILLDGNFCKMIT